VHEALWLLSHPRQRQKRQNQALDNTPYNTPQKTKGFYINATVPKWKAWRMYDYVTQELPALLAARFPSLDTKTASIMGHSMVRFLCEVQSHACGA
jgi:S-formylglutathione hydrolase FrmB